MTEAPCERQAMNTALHHATLHHAVAARWQTRRRAVDPRPGTAVAMAGETHGVICCCMTSRLCCSRPVWDEGEVALNPGRPRTSPLKPVQMGGSFGTLHAYMHAWAGASVQPS